MAVYALADKPGVAGVAYVDIDAMASRAEILRMVDRVAKGDGRLPSPLTGTSGAVSGIGQRCTISHFAGDGCCLSARLGALWRLRASVMRAALPRVGY